MHPSDSSSGVLQPTAVTNTTHPRLSTTLIHMTIHFPRMWAQLQMEQGSTKTKHTLEVEYRALQPNDRQEWERQVRSFINNNSDSGAHPVASSYKLQNAAFDKDAVGHGLEADFSILSGRLAEQLSESSIQDRIIAELLEFHQTNGRWPREIENSSSAECVRSEALCDALWNDVVKA